MVRWKTTAIWHYSFKFIYPTINIQHRAQILGDESFMHTIVMLPQQHHSWSVHENVYKWAQIIHRHSVLKTPEQL